MWEWVSAYVGYAYGARQLYRVVYSALSAAHNMQYVHKHTHINEYVIYTQARYNSACEKYANRVQFACKVASGEPRQVKLQQARLRLQRAVRGSGKWQAQLISNASSHFPLSLSVCVCVHTFPLHCG